MSIEAPESVNGQAQNSPARVRFGPAKGNVLAPEWAAWMLTEWRNAELANAKPPRFSDILQRAAVHFMMEGD